MKKIFIVVSLCALMAATGCQAVMDNNSPIARENHEIVNFRNRSEGFNVINPDKDYHEFQRFGFVRHKKETALPRGGTHPHIALYDPELLADAISKLALKLPNVHDVATLVTDRHVLVAYETNSDNRFETADQVKKTAMSAVPRFFNVYVSDKPQMINSIERFGSLSTRTEGVDDVLENTINEMLESPQGRRISASENENGENDQNMNRFRENHHYHDQKRRQN